LTVETHRVMCWLMHSLILSVFFFAVYGTTAQGFQIHYSKSGEIITKTVNLDALKPDVVHKVSVPHPTTNPKEEVATWAGVSVTSLIKLNVPGEFDPSTPVTIIANDGYVIQSTLASMSKEQTYIATLLNGKAIPHKMGEHQLIYPLAQKNNSEYALDAWWAWFNRALIVGSLPPSVKVNGMSKNVSAIGPKVVVEALPPYPVGKIKKTPGRTKYSFSCLELSKLSGDKKVEEAKLIALNGTVNVISNPEKFHVCHQWNDEVIDPWVGGPVQVCQKENPSRCFFYITAIDFTEL
jgi:hypothetical protein